MADPKFTREVSAVGFNVRNGDGDALGGLSAVDVNGTDAVRLSGDVVDIGGKKVQFTAEQEVDLKSSSVKIREAVADDEPVTKSQLGQDWEVVAPVINPEDIFLIPGTDETNFILSWYSDNDSEIGSYARLYLGDSEVPVGVFTGTISQASHGKMTHTVTLTGIDKSGVYSYDISNDNMNWTPKYEIVLSNDSIMKFAVVSDIHARVGYQADNFSSPSTVEQGWKDCVTQIEGRGVDLILATGDNVDTGNVENQYTVLASPHQLRSIPFAPVLGNHDAFDNFKYRFSYPNKNPAMTNISQMFNYWFKRGRVLFVVLNTSAWVSNVQSAIPFISAFRDTIQQAKAAHVGEYDFLIVSHHKSTASIAMHTCDEDIEKYVEAGFEALMTEQGVDVVFAGHDHVRVNSQMVAWNFMQGGSTPVTSDGTYYLTLGSSSGAKFYNDRAWNPNFESETYPLLADGTRGSANLSELNPPATFGEYDDTIEPEYIIVEVDGLTMTIQSYDLDGIAILNPIVIDKN